MGMLRKVEEWRKEEEERRERGCWVAEAIERGEMTLEVVRGVEELDYAEVVMSLKKLSQEWTGKTVQKQMYGALKRRERELIGSGEADGWRAYLRRRQLQDAQLRPDRRMQKWGQGGAVSTARGRADATRRGSRDRKREGW